MLPSASCPVCESPSRPYDVVDLNKSCEEQRGKFLPLAGVPIYYYLCQSCGFCFAPEFSSWPLEEFESKIYTDAYITVDPDYLENRPRDNAQLLTQLFGVSRTSIRHLDYGGGNGLLSKLLVDSGWESSSYDPFVDRQVQINDLGKFDLISAFEVFEHVPTPSRLIGDLASLIKDDGLVIFTTLISEGNIDPAKRLSWWYASPRNGHVSLYTANSLALLGAKKGFQYASFSNLPDLLHVYFRNIPHWAQSVAGGK